MLAGTSTNTGCPVHAWRQPHSYSSYSRCPKRAYSEQVQATAQTRPSRGSIKVRASAGGSSEEEKDPDARLAELERGRRRRNSATQTKPKQASSSAPASKQAEWKEGQLFPEGWEEMNPLQKATELYTGKRGILFWATKVTYASLFIIGGAWILFRVVGPLTGLYKLENDLLSPPNL